MKLPNVVIAQSGGPSAVINQSLVGAAIAAMAAPEAGRVLGARHGIDGVLKGDFIDLRRVSREKLEAIAATPSSALGSVRHKPSPETCDQILDALLKRKVGFFFYIGGNDSADTARLVAERAAERKAPLQVVHIPKTIDCDLRVNDHTPGYGSAARFVACALRGDDLDNRALGGVKIDVIMGRDAGYLTAAAALARSRRGDGPHLVYVPERPFSIDQFVADVRATLDREGRCVVAVSEGIRDKDGTPIAALFGGERDAHGNLQLSGTGALGDLLSRAIKEKLGVKRTRADTFGYLQRTMPGIVSKSDSREARAVGACAVRHAFARARRGAEAAAFSVAILRAPGKDYKVTYKVVPVADVARETRCLPDAFLAANGHDVTPAFLRWAAPLVGDLPRCEIF